MSAFYFIEIAAANATNFFHLLPWSWEHAVISGAKVFHAGAEALAVANITFAFTITLQTYSSEESVGYVLHESEFIAARCKC